MPININPHYSRSRKLGFFATSLIVLVAAVAGLTSAMGAKLKVDDLFRPDQLLEIQIKMLPSDYPNSKHTQYHVLFFSIAMIGTSMGL